LQSRLAHSPIEGEDMGSRDRQRHLLTRQGGYVVNNDLPGVDRPEAAEALGPSVRFVCPQRVDIAWC
jgi:hypothetical protein